jgi:hypothetical protein
MAFVNLTDLETATRDWDAAPWHSSEPSSFPNTSSSSTVGPRTTKHTALRYYHCPHRRNS